MADAFDSGAAPIDLARVSAIADGDTAFERELLLTFVGDVEKKLRGLSTALDAGEFSTVKLECHSIKGACMNMGALALRGRAEICEAAALEQDLAAARAALETMQAEYTRIRDMVKELVR